MRHVLIADDHEVTRRGIKEILLEEFESVEVCEATDAQSALAAVPSRPWDLIVLDVLMPGASGLEVLATIRATNQNVPVLIMTAATEIEYIIHALEEGANGLIHKHRAAAELIGAIARVMSGGTYLDEDTAMAVATSLHGAKTPPPHERLSRRELEVFRLIALGRTVKEIAHDLGLSDKTVATYLARIREKTGLTNHVEIARYALRHGLVD